MELLVVIAIIGILAVLVAPAFKGISSGNALTQSAARVVAEVDLGRRIAMSENAQIELRFFRLPDGGGSDSDYQTIQLFRVRDGVPVRNPQRISDSVVMMSDLQYSTLLSTENPNAGTATFHGQSDIPYKAVRFTPSGATNLDPRGAADGADRWFLTLKMRNATPGDGRPADNFITVQIDPVTGRAKTFQP